MNNSNGQIELKFESEQGQSARHVLNPGVYILGRSEECEIRFPADQLTISRRHARLTVAPDAAEIEDLGSRTGTSINGHPIKNQRLQKGDEIRIGAYSLHFSVPDCDVQTADSQFMAPVGSAPELDAVALEEGLQHLSQGTEKMMTEVGQRIIGQQDIIRAVWATILTREHCLMVGVPGLAKTLLVTTFAEALGLDSKRIQFTPDLMPSDIIGSNVIQETSDGRRQFEFMRGPVFTQLLLADEINRTPPKTQSALLEAMQERQVTVGNQSLLLPNPFCVIATQNPIEQEGTYPLPEAQQDRFMLCLYLDYPDKNDEVEILIRTSFQNKKNITSTLSHSDILVFQEIVERTAITRELAEYAASLVRATRPGTDEAPKWLNEIVEWGAGPRAGQSLLKVAKALAAMDGRPAISSDDIVEMAVPVLRHRLLCNYKARAQGLNEADIIRRLLDETPMR